MKMGDIQDEVLRYWLKTCPESGGIYPSRKDMKVTDLRNRLAYVAVLDIEANPLDFRYRLVGTRLREFLYADYTGRSFRELEGKGPDSQIWDILNRVRTSEKPLYCEVPYVGPKADFKQASSLYLPLASDHVHIDKIMVVTNFKRIDQIDLSGDIDPSIAKVFEVPHHVRP